MPSLAMDAEVDENEDDRDLAGLRASFEYIRDGDIVKFSIVNGRSNFSGRLRSVRHSEEDGIEQVEIEHLDAQHRGQCITYRLDQLFWIVRECNCMPDNPIRNFSELHPKMLITVTTASGDEVSG